jgi:hypothetical protein
MVKKKVLPLPIADSTHIFPLCSAAIFLQWDKPMPDPSYSERVCSR